MWVNKLLVFQRNKKFAWLSMWGYCKDCQKATGSGKATILVIRRRILQLKETLNFMKRSGVAACILIEGFVRNVDPGLLVFIRNERIVFVKYIMPDDSSWVTIDSKLLLIIMTGISQITILKVLIKTQI